MNAGWIYSSTRKSSDKNLHVSPDPLGGVKNLKVVDPSISTLTVRWDPAVGNVRTYKVFYAAQPGGEQQVVRAISSSS